jgi:predicted component of type VI protein secretion system
VELTLISVMLIFLIVQESMFVFFCVLNCDSDVPRLAYRDIKISLCCAKDTNPRKANVAVDMEVRLSVNSNIEI